MIPYYLNNAFIYYRNGYISKYEEAEMGYNVKIDDDAIKQKVSKYVSRNCKTSRP